MNKFKFLLIASLELSAVKFSNRDFSTFNRYMNEIYQMASMHKCGEKPKINGIALLDRGSTQKEKDDLKNLIKGWLAQHDYDFYSQNQAAIESALKKRLSTETRGMNEYTGQFCTTLNKNEYNALKKCKKDIPTLLKWLHSRARHRINGYVMDAVCIANYSSEDLKKTFTEKEIELLKKANPEKKDLDAQKTKDKLFPLIIGYINTTNNVSFSEERFRDVKISYFMHNM